MPGAVYLLAGIFTGHFRRRFVPRAGELTPRLIGQDLKSHLRLQITAATGDALPEFRDLFNGKDLTGWVNVNTVEDTWKLRDGVLICSGHPIGVMRSEKQYENFVLHIEWMHIEPGGGAPTPSARNGELI